MPIYEYRCKACGHALDALQKFSDAPLKKCPDCGRRMLERLMSAPSFRLKGGGWYETDFKSDNEKKRNLVESDAGGKNGGAEAASDGAGKESTAKDAGGKDGSGKQGAPAEVAKDSGAAKGAASKDNAAAKPKSTPGPTPSKAIKTSKGKRSTRAAAD